MKLIKMNSQTKQLAALMLILLAILLTVDVCAQERKGVSFAAGGDITSAYLWRGVYQTGVSFQPTLSITAGNFSATAWGSVDFASSSYKEMDLTLAYTLGPVTFSLADLYWEGSGERESVSRNYFHFGADSPHRVEVGVSWSVSERVPITLSWYTILLGSADVNAAGRRAYSTYIEAAYPFTVKHIDLRAGVGIVPWNAMGTYGIDRDFYVQNIFLNAGRMWEIKGAHPMQFGVFTHLIWNPAAEDVNFVGGICFRI